MPGVEGADDMARRWLLGCALAALAVSAAIVGAAWYLMRTALPLTEVPIEPQDLVERVPSPPTRPMNLLILGVDGDETRTDVIILARWDPPGRQLSLVSLPRDTLVEIPCPPDLAACISPDKLGHAHAYGTVSGQGPALIRATVEGLLGVPVDHYVRLDFEGFEQVVDALGGITIAVESDMPDIGLTRGTHHMAGEQALAYVRDRSDGMGDIGRIQRTHHFLQALADQIGEGSVDQPALLRKALPQVATDLDLAAMLAVARDWLALRQELEVRTTFLPGEAGTYRGLWVWRVNENEKAALVKEYLTAPRSSEPASIP
jgi:polyisoprenyl-teichoic acid--peptidoglycan teichoic acid transferase